MDIEVPSVDTAATLTVAAAKADGLKTAAAKTLIVTKGGAAGVAAVEYWLRSSMWSCYRLECLYTLRKNEPSTLFEPGTATETQD